MMIAERRAVALVEFRAVQNFRAMMVAERRAEALVEFRAVMIAECRAVAQGSFRAATKAVQSFCNRRSKTQLTSPLILPIIIQTHFLNYRKYIFFCASTVEYKLDLIIVRTFSIQQC